MCRNPKAVTTLSMLANTQLTYSTLVSSLRQGSHLLLISMYTIVVYRAYIVLVICILIMHGQV